MSTLFPGMFPISSQIPGGATTIREQFATNKVDTPGKRGRKKVYATAAEKKRAYRERRRKEKERQMERLKDWQEEMKDDECEAKRPRPPGANDETPAYAGGWVYC